MSTVVLFPSVLGVREGVRDAAARFRAVGHAVHIVDLYDGKVFDDYGQAGTFVEALGYPVLMQSALNATRELTGPLVCAGFSNGGAMSEYVATQRSDVSHVLNFAGALPLSLLGVPDWPQHTAVQLHYAEADPFRQPAWVAEFVAAISASGARFESYLDYPGAGHLFSDASLPAEYDAESAELMFARALDFIR